MSGPDTHTGPEAPEAPEIREQMTLDQALKEYGENYQRLLALETTRSQAREKLAELASEIEGKEKVKIPPELKNDREFLQSQIVLSHEEMEVIRAKIVTSIMKEVEEMPADLTSSQRSEAAGEYVKKVSKKIGRPDLFLVRDVAQRVLEFEAKIAREKSMNEQDPEKKKQLLQDAENLEEARNRMTFPSGQDIQVPDLKISEEADKHWVRGILALPHQILEGLNDAGDWLGNTVGKPQNFRDITAAGMLVGAGKLTLAIAAILNLAGLGVSQWNTASNIFRYLKSGDGGKAIEEIPNFFKNIVTVLPSSIATSGAAIYLATRDGDLTDIDPYLSRGWQNIRNGVNYAASNEYFATAVGGVRSAVASVQETAGPLLEQGKEGFNSFMNEHGYPAFASLKSGVKEEWNALGLWAKGIGVELDDYQKHFETISDFQGEINQYFSGLGHPDVTPPSVTVSVEKFNEFITQYMKGNENKATPEIREINMKGLVEMGFITQAEADLIPKTAEAFKPSSTLAGKFIEQGLWWRAQSNVTK
jgi:hypothetical protein